MKKLLTGLLALLTCFTCVTAVACGDNGDNTGNANSNTGNEQSDSLQIAADYLKSMYRDKYAETRQDYELPATMQGFAITWTVDVTEGVEIVAGADKVTVKVTPAEEDIKYVLTATLTDGTNTVSVKFNYTVLAVRDVPYEVITVAPVAGTAYKYVLYQNALNTDLYFAGSMSGYYFQSTSSPMDAVDLYAEYVADSTTEFKLYFTDSKDVKQYIGVQEGWNGTNNHWTFNVVFATEAPSTFTWNEDLKTVVTTVPCRSEADYENKDAEQTATETLYIGTYNEYKTFSASTLDKAKDSYVGYLATFDINKLSDQDKADLDATDLKVSTSFSVNASIDLPSAGKIEGVTVAWTVAENDYVTIADGKLNVTVPATAATVKLTATITCGEATATKEFELSLVPATQMTIPEALAAADGTTIAVSGTVCDIGEAWNAGYGNMSVTIKDEAGNELYVYRLTTKVALGDIITVTGVMATYKENRQIGQGSVAVINGHDSSYDVVEYTKMSLTEAAAAEDGTLVEVSGTVCQVNNAWSDQYSNMNVTITDDEGNKLYVYRLATKVTRGDIITVQGKVGSYEGAKQIAAGATATVTGHDKNYDVIEYKKVSIPEALKEADGVYVEVSGTVTKIKDAWNTTYNNMNVYIKDDAGNELYIYRLKTQVEVGDVITVKGLVDSYNGAKQIAEGATAEKTGTHTCSNYTDATCKAPKTCVVCGTTVGEATNNHNYGEDHICTVCGKVDPEHAGSVAEPVTVSVTIANMGWTNSTQYKTLTMDEVITVTANGGSNTGKYYTSGNQWRIYYSENPTVVVSAKSGYTIKTIKITYVIEKGGVLTYGEAQIASNTVVDVNAASITFGVDDTVLTDGDNGANKAGQVRITAIEVVYVANN